MAKGDPRPEGMDILGAFNELPLAEQKKLYEELTAAYNLAVDASKAELLGELELWGGKNGAAQKAHVMFRGPNGEEWSGRGALPRWAKDLGVTDRAGLEQYKVKP